MDNHIVTPLMFGMADRGGSEAIKKLISTVDYGEELEIKLPSNADINKLISVSQKSNVCGGCYRGTNKAEFHPAMKRIAHDFIFDIICHGDSLCHMMDARVARLEELMKKLDVHNPMSAWDIERNARLGKVINIIDNDLVKQSKKLKSFMKYSSKEVNMKPNKFESELFRYIRAYYKYTYVNNWSSAYYRLKGYRPLNINEPKPVPSQEADLINNNQQLEQLVDICKRMGIDPTKFILATDTDDNMTEGKKALLEIIGKTNDGDYDAET